MPRYCVTISSLAQITINLKTGRRVRRYLIANDHNRRPSLTTNSKHYYFKCIKGYVCINAMNRCHYFNKKRSHIIIPVPQAKRFRGQIFVSL
jgi:hypothetical protein